MNVKPTITIMTSREFNQDTARAKRAARHGPVYITERGRPAYVLISKEEHERLEAERAATAEPGSGEFVSLADALADNRPEADFDWEPPRLRGSTLKVPDFE